MNLSAGGTLGVLEIPGARVDGSVASTGLGVLGGEGLGGAVIDEAVTSLADELWLEREALDSLLYMLTNEALILRAGAPRWLAPADVKVRTAVRGVAQSELRRAVAARTLAAALGLADDANLAELAAAAPVPWDYILTDHLEVLRGMAGEIANNEAEIGALLAAGPPADAGHLDGDDGLGRAGVDYAYAAASRTLPTIARRSLDDFLG